jgi:hypothetical protein
MKHSEFWVRMDHHLGDTYSHSWASSQVIGGLGGRTVDEALAGGESPKYVWRAVHAALQLPPSER